MTESKTTNRCNVCNKKVKIDYFTCKCDINAKFCQEHKYPFMHDCSVDAKSKQREKLEKTNIKVVPQKLETI
jgi:predicted nucleic acid binding AN1-type Zn finger protein